MKITYNLLAPYPITKNALSKQKKRTQYIAVSDALKLLLPI